MTTKHEPNRQVSDDEQHLWARFNSYVESSDEDYVSVTQVAQNNTTLHEQRSRQIVATWASEGLVVADDSHNKAMLTEYGRQVDVLNTGLSRGESWR
jgi:uncharacterized protein YchJ